MYKIYIDLIFLMNLTVDYFLLRIVGRIFQCTDSRWRCFVAALIGSLLSCMILCIPNHTILPLIILLHGATAFFMIQISFRLKQRSLLLKALTALYMMAFLFGGIWEALVIDTAFSVKIFFMMAGATYMGICGMLYLYDSYRIARKNIYPLTISFQGKTISFYGFYDTGNQLMDPVSRHPVSIIEFSSLKAVLPEEISDHLKNMKDGKASDGIPMDLNLRPHYVICQTIGMKEHMMLVITLEKMSIYTPKEIIYVKNPVMALDFCSFALESEYKVLLNSRLLQ